VGRGGARVPRLPRAGGRLVTRARPLALALALAAVGCQGPALEAGDLPERPIALLWRDPATARRNAERLAAQAEGAARGLRGGGEGVAHVDDITGYLRRLSGAPEPDGGASAEGVAGRLALLDPRSGALAYVEGARRDAHPVARAGGGRRLLFSQPDGDQRQLFALDLASGEVARLTRGPNAHARGCLLPDGSLVASSAGIEDGQLVSRILVAPPGGDPVALSDGPRDHSPACSPTGGAVVWVSRDAKGRDSLVARAPLAAGPRPLGPGREPSFSDDGEWVLYAAPVARRFQLFRVRPDGSGRSRLGASGLEEHQPALAPGGRVLVYVVHDGYHRRLHARRIDGSGDRILTDAGEAESPIW